MLILQIYSLTGYRLQDSVLSLNGSSIKTLLDICGIMLMEDCVIAVSTPPAQ
jgi:hypothetical protein